MTVEDKELNRIREKIVSDIMNTVPDANGSVKVLSSNEIEDFVNKNKFVVIDFYATWCPPCKIMEPITHDLAEIYQSKVAFAKINTDQERAAAMQFQIRYVPTFYLFKDGKILTQFSGARKKNDFIELINQQFKPEK
ncbi:MAG: thioredoxin [Candidatus Heimdallarchaeota archaeon]|nr:thioredoxin [Candidatus Heimdallarchaeota archaeon]